MQQKTKICPRCDTEKTLSEYWKRKTRKGSQPVSLCKTCSTEKNKEWRHSNPEYEKTRYRKTKKQTREKHLIRKYGVTLKDYDRMLEKQGGCCDVCQKPESEEYKKVLHIDHCHRTGAVRGLLCRNCNHVLGLMKDNPDLMRAAADYLDNPQIPEIIGHAILEAECQQAG